MAKATKNQARKRRSSRSHLKTSGGSGEKPTPSLVAKIEKCIRHHWPTIGIAIAWASRSQEIVAGLGQSIPILAWGVVLWVSIGLIIRGIQNR